MVFGRSTLAFYLADLLVAHNPIALAFPQNAWVVSSNALSLTSTNSSAEATPTAYTSTSSPTVYTLPSGCRESIITNLPNQQTWQTCNTTGWLQDLIQDYPQFFGNQSVVMNANGFMGAFGLATGQVDGCAFGQTCMYPTYPPSAGTSDNDTQKMIVQLALYYMSSWYVAANQVLEQQQIIEQAFINEITSQLDIQQAPIANSGPNLGSVFNLIGSILSIIPNPVVKLTGGALRGISALMPPPPDNDVVSINNIIALDDLEAQLSSSGGLAYTYAVNALSTRFEQLFNEANDPMGTAGMFTMLQDGSWFDYTNNVKSNDPTSTAQANFVTYNWLLSEILVAQKVWLHALVVDTCPSSTLGIQGNNCVEFDDVTFVIWPALWNSNPAQTASIDMGENADIGVTTVQELTRHPHGGLIFANLVDNFPEQVDPNFMFSSSLLCQLNATTADDLLATWPTAAVSSVWSNSSSNCLYNLPIVIDEQQAALPSNVGLLSSIQTPNSACSQSPLYSPLNYWEQSGQVLGASLDFCQNAWSLDEYAAITLGLLSSSDNSQYYYCGGLQNGNGYDGVPCTGGYGDEIPIIPACAGPGQDNTCMCINDGQGYNGQFQRWLNGATLACDGGDSNY